MSDVEGVAQDQLRSFVERLERLAEEKKSIGDDEKDLYAEAKGNGLNVPIIKEIIKLRKMDPDDRANKEAELYLYLRAMGMQSSLNFSEAA